MRFCEFSHTHQQTASAEILDVTDADTLSQEIHLTELHQEVDLFAPRKDKEDELSVSLLDIRAMVWDIRKSRYAHILNTFTL